MTKTILFIVLLFSISISVPNAFAASPVIDAVLEKAREQKSLKRYSQAFEEYCRALILDTDNTEAMLGFQQTAIRMNFRTENRLLVTQVKDLLRTIRAIEQDTEYHRKKIDSFRATLHSAGYDDDSQSRLLTNFIPVYPHPISIDSAANIMGDHSTLQSLVVALQDALSDREQELRQASDIHQAYRSILASTVLQGGSSDLAVKPSFDSFKTADISRQNIELKKALAHKTTEINKLSSEVVRLSLELTEKETALGESFSELTRLQQQIGDLTSRLDFTKGLMVEKNNMIGELQQEIAAKKKMVVDENEELRLHLANQKQKITELEGIVQIYKGKLRDYQVAKTDVGQIDGIRSELSQLKTDLSSRDNRLNETRTILQNLEKDFSVIREYIQTVSNANIDDQQITLHELSEIEQKLFQTRRFLYEYSSELQDLHEILSTP